MGGPSALEYIFFYFPLGFLIFIVIICIQGWWEGRKASNEPFPKRNDSKVKDLDI